MLEQRSSLVRRGGSPCKHAWWLVFALAASACGGSGAGTSNVDGGSSASDGGAAVDGGPRADGGAACADPCACAERGPADYSRAGSGRASSDGGADQLAALVRANRWRTAAGLSALNGHTQLERAALAHASYLAGNVQATCWANAHSETSTCAGFTGVSPGPRAAAAGYRYRTVTEIIDWRPTIDDAVDTWIWTVYHRRSFFNHALTDVGFARKYGPYRSRQEFHNVMSFGEPSGSTPTRPAAPVVFPVPGQTGVVAAFDGAREEPLPAAPPSGWPSGTVVSVHPPSTSFTVTAHKLYRSGGSACTEVAHRFLTRDNDPNLVSRDSYEVFLYADTALAARTEYVVALEGTFDGRPWSRTWAFTTE